MLLLVAVVNSGMKYMNRYNIKRGFWADGKT